MTDPAPAAGATRPARKAPGPLSDAGAYVLVLLLALLLALWGAFLVPLRVGGTLVPVSWAVALVGNAVLCVAGGRLLGRLGTLGPVLLWLAIAILLGTKRSEGDLVLLEPTPTYGFLLAGVVGAFVAYFWLVTRQPGASSAPPR